MSAAGQSERELEWQWVLAARRRDPAAFRLLVDAYERRLLYFLLRFVPGADDALDVLQEVWLTVYRRLPALNAPEAFRVWLYQIAHDKAVSHVRGQRRQERVREELQELRGGEPEEAVPAVESAELIHRALQLLSVEHREVLTLHFLEDMRLEEIAQVLRCPLGTVKSRLHYAKQALRQEVEKRVRG
jgi:RNA polymerase sigma-70 factor (ECF subfamily)